MKCTGYIVVHLLLFFFFILRACTSRGRGGQRERISEAGSMVSVHVRSRPEPKARVGRFTDSPAGTPHLSTFNSARLQSGFLIDSVQLSLFSVQSDIYFLLQVVLRQFAFNVNIDKTVVRILACCCSLCPICSFVGYFPPLFRYLLVIHAVCPVHFFLFVVFFGLCRFAVRVSQCPRLSCVSPAFSAPRLPSDPLCELPGRVRVAQQHASWLPESVFFPGCAGKRICLLEHLRVSAL